MLTSIYKQTKFQEGIKTPIKWRSDYGEFHYLVRK